MLAERDALLNEASGIVAAASADGRLSAGGKFGRAHRRSRWGDGESELRSTLSAIRCGGLLWLLSGRAGRVHSGRRVFMAIRAIACIGRNRTTRLGSGVGSPRVGRRSSGKEYNACGRRPVRTRSQSFVYRDTFNRGGIGDRVATMGIGSAVRDRFSTDLLTGSRTRRTASPEAVSRIRELRRAGSEATAAHKRQKLETLSMVCLHEKPGVSSAPWISRWCHRSCLESLSLEP